jgi:hypothetical protein
MRFFGTLVLLTAVLNVGCSDERVATRLGLELESPEDPELPGEEEGEGEGEQPEPPKAGDDSCLDIKNCIENCPPHKHDCVQACFEFGTIEAQRAYTALERCNAANSCLSNSDCIAEKCEEAAENCGVPEPYPGPDTCVGIFECFDGCGPRGRPCLYACIEQAEPRARQAYDELVSCMDRHCEDLQENEELRECAKRECAEEMADCLGEIQ